MKIEADIEMKKKKNNRRWRITESYELLNEFSLMDALINIEWM